MVDISVIMPVYNKENMVFRTIKSVLNQSYKNFQLIIINDGSTDSSMKIIKENFDDSRILLLEQENKGVSHARNKGLEIADTEYVTFIDADDEYNSYFLERMISTIADANVAYCGFYYKANDNDKRKSSIKFAEGDILRLYLYNRCLPNTNCWLIKKDYLDKHLIRFSSDLSWGEDMEFFSKVLFHDNNIRSSREFLTYYNKGIEGALSENSIRKIEQDIAWMIKLKKYILNYEEKSKRKVELIKSIDSYRLPASIIYRLNKNLKNYDKDKLQRIYENYKRIVEKMKFSNGLKSVKLYIYYLKVNFLLNRR